MKTTKILYWSYTVYGKIFERKTCAHKIKKLVQEKLWSLCLNCLSYSKSTNVRACTDIVSKHSLVNFHGCLKMEIFHLGNFAMFGKYGRTCTTSVEFSFLVM